jgi:hypothetical protein
MARPGVERVVCDVGALVVPDGVAVDALARLQLAARRRGCRVARPSCSTCWRWPA